MNWIDFVKFENAVAEAAGNRAGGHAPRAASQTSAEGGDSRSRGEPDVGSWRLSQPISTAV
jgi:hypothetical protein